MTGFIAILLSTLLIVVPVVVQAATLTVRMDGTGHYSTIQEAISASSDGDEILIGSGTWQEPVLTIFKDLAISSESGRELTILDGQFQNRLMHFTNGCQVSVTGLTLTRARFNDGAAVHVDNAAVVEFLDCLLSNNEATHVGGAGFVRHNGSRLTFRECDFINNNAPLNAGGVGISINSSCHFFDCVFKGNVSNNMAGAVANFDDALMEVSGCLFVRNKGEQCGAIRVLGAPAIIENNTFVEHTSGMGTIFIDTSHLVICSNNIFAGEVTGFGIYNAGYGPALLDCNLFFNNNSGPAHGINLNSSNLFTDPLFCFPDMDDFSLCDFSPAAPPAGNCGLVGALGVGCNDCGPVSTDATTWGGLKALYRGTE